MIQSHSSVRPSRPPRALPAATHLPGDGCAPPPPALSQTCAKELPPTRPEVGVGLQVRHQRRLVNHGAARRVHQHRVRLHLVQPAGLWEAIVQQHKVGELVGTKVNRCSSSSNSSGACIPLPLSRPAAAAQLSCTHRSALMRCRVWSSRLQCRDTTCTAVDAVHACRL